MDVVESKFSNDSSGDKKDPDEKQRQGELALNDERLPEGTVPEPKVKQLQDPIWTENKAKLIERYLFYFVQITKHGTYIDGFAGPQRPDKPDMWAAKLVLESEPRWFRHFHLFDRRTAQVRRLRALESLQPIVDIHGKKIHREICVREGDFNLLVHELLQPDKISQKEATFCLLDQRTFQCHWSTVKALAGYKPGGNNKIEIFYFLARGWIRRALSALKNKKIMENWWGRDDWADAHKMDPQQLCDAFSDRFKTELGYKSVKPWPIYKRQDNSIVMYYMIHATDHPDAPSLMARAYERAVGPKETPEQLRLELGVIT